MDNNTPVYDFEAAINFISKRCDISKDIIEKILMLEEDYMRSIGIIKWWRTRHKMKLLSNKKRSIYQIQNEKER